jgi:SAM-dependent methyltransferase
MAQFAAAIQEQSMQGSGEITFLEVQGKCPICGPGARFVAKDSWLRDNFACTRCQSLPRERALMVAIDMYMPNWAELAIHESSPIWRGVSSKLKAAAPGYTFSYFAPDRPLGGPHFMEGAINQNVEQMTFENETFDLFVTQDVFEHIFRPDLAIREIERVLKPGGRCIMTVPMVNMDRPSERRAEMLDGEVRHYKPPAYHGDPVNADGALVTMDWGFDACAYLAGCSALRGALLVIDDLNQGIRAAYNEIIVLKKGLPQIL